MEQNGSAKDSAVAVYVPDNGKSIEQNGSAKDDAEYDKSREASAQSGDESDAPAGDGYDQSTGAPSE